MIDVGNRSTAGVSISLAFIALAACTSFIAIGVIVAFSIARKIDDRVTGAPLFNVIWFVYLITNSGILVFAL